MIEKRGIIILIGLLLPLASAWGYHPFSTDDPGTVEFRHFELEWGNDGVFEEDALDDLSGYLQVKSGLAKGLELDLAQSFTYWRDPDYGASSGFGDGEVALKFRFYGDGDGPFNLGLESIFHLPSGERDKGLSEGEEIIPCLFLIGTLGKERVRAIMNVGASLPEDEDAVWLLGMLVEYSVNEKLSLGAEFYGESTLRGKEEEDSSELLIGAVYSALDWLTLSGGASIGLDSEAPDFRLSFATLFGW